MSKTSKNTIVTAPRLGAHLGVSSSYIVRLVSDGVIQKRSDGRFDQDQARLSYLTWLRDPARRSARSEAASELQKAKARQIQLKNAELEGSVISMEDAIATQDALIGTLREGLAALPHRVTRDLELRRKIDDELNAVLNKAADAALAQAEQIERQIKR